MVETSSASNGGCNSGVHLGGCLMVHCTRILLGCTRTYLRANSRTRTGGCVGVVRGHTNSGAVDRAISVSILGGRGSCRL